MNHKVGLTVNLVRDGHGLVHAYRYNHQFTLCGLKNMELAESRHWYVPAPITCEKCRDALLGQCFRDILAICGYVEGLSLPKAS